MDVAELAEMYSREAVDNIAVTELYTAIDCTDIKSNAYEFRLNDQTQITLTFDKYGIDWLPFVSDPVDESPNGVPVAEGQPPPTGTPTGLASMIAESVYNNFKSDSWTAPYEESSVDGLRDALEAFRGHAGREPDVVVVDDELLDDDTIIGIEEIEGVDVYESEYLDLGAEVLVTNKSFGYLGTRTPVQANTYIDADPFSEASDEPSIETPYVVQCHTRIGTIEAFPKRGIRFTRIDEM